MKQPRPRRRLCCVARRHDARWSLQLETYDNGDMRTDTHHSLFYDYTTYEDRRHCAATHRKRATSSMTSMKHDATMDATISAGHDTTMQDAPSTISTRLARANVACEMCDVRLPIFVHAICAVPGPPHSDARAAGANVGRLPSHGTADTTWPFSAS